jgi:hypothetical protein
VRPTEVPSLFLPVHYSLICHSVTDIMFKQNFSFDVIIHMNYTPCHSLVAMVTVLSEVRAGTAELCEHQTEDTL